MRVGGSKSPKRNEFLSRLSFEWSFFIRIDESFFCVFLFFFWLKNDSFAKDVCFL